MKKFLLFIFIPLITINVCSSQDWFINFDVAKRLALVQDKMLFVVWEQSFDYSYPIKYFRDDNEKRIVLVSDLSKKSSLDALIWEHFIPVLLPETEYDELIKKAEGRGYKYLAKLNDDSIKIMDTNMNILNIEPVSEYEQNLSLIINNYSLKTTFIKQDLINYSNKQNSTTAFNLGSKYVDFSLFVEEDTRIEIIELANIYFDEARNYFIKENLTNKNIYTQRIDLIEIKENLILNKARKANRALKKINTDEIAEVNKSLYNFLKYTTFKLLKDEENAALMVGQVSELDLKKSELILNINN